MIVNVVRTRLLVEEPVADSNCTLKIKNTIKIIENHCFIICHLTFLIVVLRTLSPSAIKLYACHISSGSSGIKVTDLKFEGKKKSKHNLSIH